MDEKQIVKNSIFKQRVFRKEYEFIGRAEYRKDYGSGMWCKNKIYHLQIDEKLIEIKNEEVFRCELEMPILNINEKFYIEEKDVLVTIKEQYRTSKENIIYIVEDKIIENSITKDSKDKAEILREKFNIFKDANEELEKHLNNITSKLNRYKTYIREIQKSFWFRFIKEKFEEE